MCRVKHQYGLPINSLDFHPKTKTIVSTDTKVIKISHMDSGKSFTSVEPGYQINQSVLVP